LKISRLDLDGVGSPSALVARILTLEPELPTPVPLEQLCERLDIVSIEELDTDGFEAALVTDPCKAAGGILVARGRSRQRRRFSIAHELGQFLIPTHVPSAEGRCLCSSEDLRRLEQREQDRRARMEAEANRFAALLLMPLPILRHELRRGRLPDLTERVRLARLFDVSKEAMARSYAEHHHEPVAVVIVRDGKVLRSYRKATSFPWIDAGSGSPVPAASTYHGCHLERGAVSEVE
jgi:Zn-dependent peptidase ImmA (M78 family)